MFRSSVWAGIFAVVFLVGIACAADWPFLADGSSQIGIADCARLVYLGASPCFPVEVFGTLTGATLVVTYDSGVPVETRSWGTIKGLYR